MLTGHHLVLAPVLGASFTALFVILSSAVHSWNISSSFTDEDLRLREADQLA